MANFILADNQELTRFAVESLIRRHGEHTIQRAVDRVGLLEHLKNFEHSVVVLDYTLFDFVDVEQLLIVSERFSMAGWILLSDELTPKLIRRLVYSSNAFSIVFKDCPLYELKEALQAASRNSRYICQRAMGTVVAELQEEEVRGVLTQTEKEIVKAIAQGKTTKEIAAERFLSIHTINTHRKNIFRKLKVNTAHEAIKYALRAGWVDQNDF